MANIGVMIERMSEYLDKGRPDVKVITAKCRRATAIRFVKPRWPGGPLVFKGREIVTMDPVTRPQPPAPKKPKRVKA